MDTEMDTNTGGETETANFQKIRIRNDKETTYIYIYIYIYMYVYMQNTMIAFTGNVSPIQLRTLYNH